MATRLTATLYPNFQEGMLQGNIAPFKPHQLAEPQPRVQRQYDQINQIGQQWQIAVFNGQRLGRFYEPVGFTVGLR